MSALAILKLVRRFWWAPVIVGLAIGLFATRSTLARVRADVAVQAARRDKALSDAVAVNAQKARDASDAYATRLATLQPVIVRATDKVTTYASTPAGRAPCLSGERVRDIAADRAALFPDPSGSDPAVPADPAAVH